MSAYAFDNNLVEEQDNLDITIPKCIVEFRPHRKWVGEFGFDWVRTGDTNFGAQYIPEMAEMQYKKEEVRDKVDPFRDFAFKNCVGYVPFVEKTDKEGDSEKTKRENQKENARRDKEIGKVEVLDKEQYTYTNKDSENGFELVYDKYRKLNISDKLYKELLKQYESESIDEQTYYIPVLSLLEGNTAKLDLYITAEYTIDKIEFKIVGKTPEALSLDTSLFNNIQTGKGELNITISCEQEFSEPLYIEVYRFSEEDIDSKLCGKLKIIPNSKKYKKEVKIVLVKIVTQLNKEKVVIEKDKLQEIRDGVAKFFAQALLIPQFEEIEVPLYDDDAQAILVQNSVILTDIDCQRMELPEESRVLTSQNNVEFSAKVHQIIKERIPKEIEIQYKQYFKVFLVEEPLYTKSEDYIVEGSQQGGVSLYTDRGNLICFRGGNDSGTVTHELFHSHGLTHTFSGFNPGKYCFKQNHTSNLMDYSKKRISIYYWQWKQVNKNIK